MNDEMEWPVWADPVTRVDLDALERFLAALTRSGVDNRPTHAEGVALIAELRASRVELAGAQHDADRHLKDACRERERADNLTASVAEVGRALKALGSAWRGDWADFDGRTLRDQVDDLAKALSTDTHAVYEHLCADLEICPVNRSWAEHCPEADRYMCPHLMAAYESRNAARAALAGEA